MENDRAILLPTELNEWISHASVRLGLSRRELLEKALWQYLKRQASELEPQPDRLATAGTSEEVVNN